MSEVGAMLQEMTANCRRKVPGDWNLVVQLDVRQPAVQSWHVVVAPGQRAEPGRGVHPQALIFVSGQGWAKIGEQTVPVRAGESYYIPPGADRVVWNTDDELLVLIVLAWGPGA